jgi:hypothetical protein
MARNHVCLRWRFAEVRNQFKAAWLIGAVIIALQIIDILSTEGILLAGGSEDNPVVSTLIGMFGPAWWIPKLVLTSLIAGHFATQRLSWAGIIVVAVCAMVVTHNLLQPV